ncbi:MAG: hypothetical protein FJX20_01340 [Alphaproteobacteria bacterium]|nr:hypothetical protein [Alphaproteobacteria bacterium]
MAVRQKTSAPLWERIAIFAFGVVFVSLLIGIAVALPNPTSAQYTTFRIALALAAAGVAALIPGFIEVKAGGTKTLIRAGGAAAVFVIVYFFSPAALEQSGLVTACGGVAAGRDIRGSTVIVTNAGTVDCK